MAFAETELVQQLAQAGNRLLNPPSSVADLLLLLDQVESFLSRVQQSPSKSMQAALSPSLRALVADELLRHSDTDVNVAVASCISEITRITAPDAPYDDDKMKDVFQLIVSSFQNLSDKSSRSYNKRTSILGTVAKVRSCVVMLDLECDGLIIEMFQHFIKSIRDYHLENVFSAMETIMTLVLEESEDISLELLSPLLASLKRDNEEVLPIAQKLGESVFGNCAFKLKLILKQAVKSMGHSLDDYSEVIASICEGKVAVEHNDDNAVGEQLADGSKLARRSLLEAVQADMGKVTMASLDEAGQVAKESMTEESAAPGQVNPSMDRSLKSEMSNGAAETGTEGTSVTPESLVMLEDDHRANKSVDANETSKVEPVVFDAPNVVMKQINQGKTGKRRGRKPSCSKNPCGTPQVDNEKETETLPDSASRSKEGLSSTSQEPSGEGLEEAVLLEMSSGSAESGNEGTSVNPESLVKLEDNHSANKSVNANETSIVELVVMDARNVVIKEINHGKTAKRRGRKPSSKKTPCDSPQVDNEKEAETLLDRTSRSKEPSGEGLEETFRSETTNGAAETGNKGTSVNPESLVKLEDDHHANRSVIANETSKVEPVVFDAQNVVTKEINQGKTAKRRGRKPSSSKNPCGTPQVDNEKETETAPGRTSHSKEVHSSPSKEPSGEGLEEVVRSEIEKETGIELPSAKALEDETLNAANPSQSGSLPDKIRLKKVGRPKKKGKLIQEASPSTADVSIKASEKISDSEIKPQKHSGTRTHVGSVNDDKFRAQVNASKNLGETTNFSEAKPMGSGNKMDAGNFIDGSAIKEDKKRRGRPKVVKKSSNYDDNKIVPSPMSTRKLAKDEGHLEETPKTNSKGKRTPRIVYESETLVYGQNLVGSRVKVWWPVDKMFYEGAIGSFDASKRKHKVLYSDGDEEILNLKNERWEFITGDSDSVEDGEQATEFPSPDASSDKHKRKKAKPNSDPSAKQGITEVLPKRGRGVLSSNGKGATAKSSLKTRNNDIVDNKTSDTTSKSGGMSEDDSSVNSKDHPRSGKSIIDSSKRSRKPKGNGGTPKTSAKSKQETPEKIAPKDGANTITKGTPKDATKSIAKPSKRGRKPNVKGTGNVKSSLVEAGGSEDEKEKSPEPVKTPESAKGEKSVSASKPREAGTKRGKKRRRT